jgi:cytochrome c553
MQNGNRTGSLVALMQAVVAKLSYDDMVAITAYLASRAP